MRIGIGAMVASPGLPVGYVAETGTISPSNVTGATTVGGQTIESQNQPSLDCSALGGTVDPATGVCEITQTVTQTDYTPVYIAGGIAVFALLMIMMSGRRR